MYDDDLELEWKWTAYAVMCIKNITPRFIRSIKNAEQRAMEAANRNNKIFTAPIGSEQILWKCDRGVLVPASAHERGWRENLDGTREAVFYYGGEWGWMSVDERYEAMREYPRTAP